MSKKKPCRKEGIDASCARCGTCCMKGGPALHKEDKELLIAGNIKYEQLVTIRKGELAYSPLSGRFDPVKKELVKIAGKGKTWACCLYDEKNSSCTIYSQRPLECRLLQCRDTSGLLKVIGRGTLTRSDIIVKDAPIMKFIAMHEMECSVQAAEDLASVLMDKNSDSRTLAKLTALIHKDLAIRSKAISEFGLSLGLELFYFGRPLFKIAGSRGINCPNND